MKIFAYALAGLIAVGVGATPVVASELKKIKGLTFVEKDLSKAELKKLPHLALTGENKGVKSSQSSKDRGQSMRVVMDGATVDIPYWALVGLIRSGAVKQLTVGMGRGELMELLWNAGYPRPGEPFPEPEWEWEK